MADETVSDNGAGDFWTVGSNLRPDQSLAPDSDLYVETEKARGEFTFHELYIQLELNPRTMKLGTPKDKQFILFAGHRGCGKSTELRRLSARLHAPDRFFVIFFDALQELDIHNLQYSDVLLALAARLCQTLDDHGATVDPVFLTSLNEWFAQRVQSRIDEEALSTELKVGATADIGLPLIGKIFASLTSAIKFGSSYKEEVRLAVRNNFAQFAEGFNQLIAAADESIQTNGLGRKILFIVDGTDRLGGEDKNRFFVDDVHQLQQVSANFIYCAPIDLLSESTAPQNRYDHLERMPMIKLHERDDSTPIPAAYEAMREMVHRRVSLALFDGESTVDYLIENSGGHPRDLVRLLNLTRQSAKHELFDRPAAEKAVDKLALEFKYLLEPTDYALIYKIDTADEPENSERARFLLHNLAILEYNAFWRRSHPAVRTLPGYIAAAQDHG